MKVVASPTLLDAFEWDGSEEIFEKIKEFSVSSKDDVYIRDGQLIVYNNAFETEEIVKIGYYVVFETYGIDVYSPIAFDILYQEVK